MSRLTVKKEDKYNIAYKDKGVHLQFLYDADDAVKDLVNSTNAVIQKLGEYEDLEENLGVDFYTFIQAFNKGIWVRGNGAIAPIDARVLVCDVVDGGEGYFYDQRVFDPLVFYFKDYKKTWALNKEDLE